MDGISTSKSTFVVTNIPSFTRAIKDDKAKISVEMHRTRASRDIYYLNATIGDQSNRLYFALPSGVSLDPLEDEKPKLILKIATDASGAPSMPEMAKFESEYREFMKEMVEPLLVASASFDAKKTMQLANFGKSDGASSKFALLTLPKSIKPEQITRLVEAKGSQILITIAYMYILDDAEKGRAIYGAIFETGRFPFSEAKAAGEKPPRPAKRKANFTEDDENERKIVRENGIAIEPTIVESTESHSE